MSKMDGYLHFTKVKNFTQNHPKYSATAPSRPSSELDK